MTSPIRPKKLMVVLDCPDSAALASFYGELLGWRVEDPPQFPNWFNVFDPDNETFVIACQQVDDYCKPEWPNGDIPQQAHLDFYVDSIAESTPLALAAGATKHEVQPSAKGNFIVFLDPAGHPFCLCQES